MVLIYVNNVAQANPTKYKVTLADVDSADSSRNELGVLIRNRVRAGVHKVECTWTLKTSELSTALQAVKNQSCTVKFWDPYDASYHTSTMYVGDRSCDMKLNDGTNTDNILWDVSYNFIEF